MLTYEAFQKALIRIAAMAQDKLAAVKGGRDLAEALEEETKKKRKAIARHARGQHAQLDPEKAAEKQQMGKLRQQFEQEQRLRAETTSKKPTLRRDGSSNPAAGGGGASINKQKATEESKYRVDLARVEQEEEFFARWLKQRENLGMLDTAGGDGQVRRQTTVRKADATKKELVAVNQEIKREQRLANLEVEKKEVRKRLDVSRIAASDLETLMTFLGVSEGEKDTGLTRRLTLSNRKAGSRKQPAAGEEAIGSTYE